VRVGTRDLTDELLTTAVGDHVGGLPGRHERRCEQRAGAAARLGDLCNTFAIAAGGRARAGDQDRGPRPARHPRAAVFVGGAVHDSRADPARGGRHEVPRMTLPGASIVLLTFNGEEYLEELLDAIAEQKTTFAFETIVIDSGSTDRTLEIVRRHAVRLHQIPNSKFNHGGTRN